MADLKASLVISAIDRATKPLRGLTGSVSKTGAALKKLQSSQADISGLKKLRKNLGTTGQGLDDARKKTAALGRKLAATEKPTKKLRAEFDRARKTSDALKKTHIKQKTELGKLSGGMRKAGIDTRYLGRAQERLDRQVSALNRSLARRNLMQKQWGKFKTNVGGLARKAAVGVGVLGLGVELFRRTFVQTAIDFEQFETTLTTIEGTSEKARASMKWIEDFAAKTPFDLAKVTGAFVKLRSYGLDPTGGLLRSLGDAAAGMSKPVIQAVEAIADAVTGENERLKEFGIKARADGGKFRYEYTVDGETRIAEALADDRAAIQKTLTDILDLKFGGGMAAKSKTFEGMWSNLGDQWTRFQNVVMGSGLFDKLKLKLSGALDKLNAMSESGALQKWAKDIGEKLSLAFDSIWKFGSELWPIFKGAVKALVGVKDAVGGWKNFAAILVGLKIAAVVAPLVSLGATALPLVATGIKAVGLALVANPIGAAIAAIAISALLVWKYWEPIKEKLSAGWERIKEWFGKLSLAGVTKSLLSTMAGGIKDGNSPLYNAVKASLGPLGRLLPSSDAKEGPLARLTHSGAAVLSTIGRGVSNAGARGLRQPLAQALRTATAGLALSIPAAVQPSALSIPAAVQPSALSIPAAVQPSALSIPAAVAGGPAPAGAALSPPAAGAGTVQYIDRSTQTINVSQQPGQDVKELANEVFRLFEQDREKRQRRVLFDRR